MSDAKDRRPSAARRLYRARDGLLLGVCKGVADYLFISAWLVRVIVALLFLATGFWPAGVIYLLLGIFLSKAPLPGREAYGDSDGAASSFPSGGARTALLRDLRERIQRLDGRVRRMEDAVTRSSFDWEARLRKPGS